MNQNYFKKLIEICNLKGFTIESNVQTEKKDFALYKIIINKKSRKKTLCFSAGIHGNEVSGPLGVLGFIKTYCPRKNDPRIILLPVLNPYGFLKGKYRNYDNVNLNRHFFERPQPKETKKIYSLVQKEKIDFFLSIHEDDVKNGFYIYKYAESDKIFKMIIEFLSKKSRIYKDKKIYKDDIKNGIIGNPKHDGSFEEWMYYKGVQTSACLEVPDKIPLRKRTKIIQELIHFIVNSEI